METIKIIIKLLQNMYGPLFHSPYDLISYEAKKIFSNEEDSKKYGDAVFRLKISKTESETITLSTGEILTLVS